MQQFFHLRRRFRGTEGGRERGKEGGRERREYDGNEKNECDNKSVNSVLECVMRETGIY